MKRTSEQGPLMPPIWLALLVAGIGIYGTGTAYRWLTGTGPAGDGGVGLGVMLLAVLILGTPLARAWQFRRRRRSTAGRKQID